ncbi:MAG: hypothetical protein R2856_38565 [Caldilineaceae bacterium]
MSLVALRSFGDSISRSLLTDAKELQAADVIVESNFGLSDSLAARIDELGAGRRGKRRVWEFYTVVRLPNGEGSLLSNVKAVEPG